MYISLKCWAHYYWFVGHNKYEITSRYCNIYHCKNKRSASYDFPRTLVYLIYWHNVLVDHFFCHGSS